MIFLTFFVVCGVSRLARFNVTAPQFATSDTKKVSHFEGTPIPTSIVIVGMLALMLWNGHVQEHVWLGALRIGPMRLHPLSLVYVLSGTAMISTVRIPKP
jgi:CDP-diacylglycerol--serine O-phosphatidyltransferase